MSEGQRVGVIGAGAWGTALAQAATRSGCTVRLWAREPEVVEAVNRDRENPDFLPDVILDPAIQATGDLAEACDADVVLMVVPAQFTRGVCRRLPDVTVPLVLCAKGFERDTGALMTEVAAAEKPDATLAVLSGPTFAREVALGLPAALTIACADEALGYDLIHMLGSATFRPYWSDDPVGVQIGAAVKNVLAVAAGVIMGRQLGENARAGMITRGLSEIVRLGEALGARRETLMGLSGLGDLVLTATSLTSRNTSLGEAIGRGRSLDDVLGERRTVAEGVWTAAAIAGLAERHGVDMPICRAADAILHHGADIDATIAGLLHRPFRAEY